MSNRVETYTIRLVICFNRIPDMEFKVEEESLQKKLMFHFDSKIWYIFLIYFKRSIL